MSARLLCLFVGCSLALPAVEATGRRSYARSSERQVRRAALTTWVHGMTDEVALATVGQEGVPALLRLLADPEFPRRDNVVALLAHLRDPRAIEPLIGLLAAPPRPASAAAEEDRALLMVPEALGRIASGADPSALQLLLGLFAPGSSSGALAAAIESGPYSRRMRAELVESALFGLARSGRSDAFARLNELAAAAEPPVAHGLDVATAAGRVLHSMESPVGGAERTEEAIAGFGAILDPASASTDSALTYANHVDMTSPMTDALLDQRLQAASLKAAAANFDGDVACCISVSRMGGPSSFGTSGDGLDIIDDLTERDAVLFNSVARVKLVRMIRFCSGSGNATNIAGCAHTPGNTIAVVRLSSDVESSVWLHEYGHNVGLPHLTDNQNVMNGSVAAGLNKGVNLTQCAAFHNPPAATQALLTDTGVCHDDDLDLIASNVDNCADDPNSDQLDGEGDGVGDVCDNCIATFNPTQADADANGIGDACDCQGAGSDPDGDGVCNVTDNCPDDANAGQQDADLDGIGDVCDGCTDGDADGYGLFGGAGCTPPGLLDCDDALVTVHPGAPELCDGLDNDCNAQTDEGSCDAFEFTGDGQLDGEELAWLGRAFGLCSATPAAEWWSEVDLDGDGCVDGADLAVLSAVWGCAGQQPICP